MTRVSIFPGKSYYVHGCCLIRLLICCDINRRLKHEAERYIYLLNSDYRMDYFLLMCAWPAYPAFSELGPNLISRGKLS